MPKYVVRKGEHITHDGKSFTEGDVLSCTEEQAKLLRVDPAETKQTAPAQKSTDMNVDAAVAILSRMTDQKEIKAFIKGDDRKGVNDAAESLLESLKAN